MKGNGKQDRQAKTATLVAVNAGQRTFVGLTVLDATEFDTRIGSGRCVELLSSVEVTHLSITDGKQMQNLVSMTIPDHALVPIARLRVRPESWYFLAEQDELTARRTAGLYQMVVAQASANAEGMRKQLKESEEQKATTAGVQRDSNLEPSVSEPAS